ncbi:hypothetical protein KC207_13805 [Phycicoccus sp. BSK3Z-2]|uniref:Uncharacterized protein n=1 Tax=Phycicoccus avicenniae TaxID=2828860 RepID=A0A941I1T4_9MICO|nr:DUF6308 family protein [Phycicoccus avicenniae]MBR7744364.1 hypothetical protein [Phycicoccus avicenniae]
MLDRPAAVDDVARYYDRDSNFAGATFLDLGPVDPYAVTSGDLLAITLLQVEAQPRPVRQLLEMTATNREIRHRLTEEVLPLDADLTMADNPTLVAMADLHEAMKRALAPFDGRASNRWVAASKLCARKRPDLFPVRDSVVCDLLGLSGSRQNYEVDWQVFRRIIQDDDVRSRIDAVVDEAAQREGVNIGHPNLRLRHLDVVLWMHARRGGSKS